MRTWVELCFILFFSSPVHAPRQLRAYRQVFHPEVHSTKRFGRIGEDGKDRLYLKRNLEQETDSNTLSIKTTCSLFNIFQWRQHSGFNSFRKHNAGFAGDPQTKEIELIGSKTDQ